MHFQPSRHSYGSPSDNHYGWWTAAAKARQRDRQRRKAGRDLSKYEECVAEGKGSKCDKYKTRASKHLSKAKAKDAKVTAKGKKTKGLKDRTAQFKSFRTGSLDPAAEGAEGSGIGLMGGKKGGKVVGRQQGGGEGPDMMSDEEMGMEAGELEQSSGGGFLLPIIGLLVVGGGAFAIWKMRSK